VLANHSPLPPTAGALRQDVQKPGAFLKEVVDFIAEELPRWRARPDRRSGAERVLTSQLCAHLNSVARHSAGWDILQFRTEVPDEVWSGRSIDLIPSPCGVTVWIEGRGYSDFDSLMPIECKRLPTPPDKERDRREYVFSKSSTTGGIHRFKSGYHGLKHELGAMIGYIEEDDPDCWHARITEWITDLAKAKEGGFSEADQLSLVRRDKGVRLTELVSSHDRTGTSSKISLRHIWVEMN
jgi:hypothetical protein